MLSNAKPANGYNIFGLPVSRMKKKTEERSCNWEGTDTVILDTENIVLPVQLRNVWVEIKKYIDTYC